MKVGIFTVADHYPREAARTLSRFYKELLEQVEVADELGFSSFYVAEHHFHEYGAIPRPPVFLAAAAQRTKQIRLGAAVAVLPFDNPFRSAEDYAMVDVLSNGRLSLGVGSGYLQHEYAGFGIDPDERRERFDEALAIMLKAWEGKKFSFHGKYHRYDNVQLNVVPVQSPRPPISIAILRNEVAKFVARQQFSIIMIPYATTEVIAELADTARIFKDEFVGAGGRIEDAEVRFALHVFCAETKKEAAELGSEVMDRYVRTRLYARKRAFDDLVTKDLIAVGDPEQVLRVMQVYKDMGITEFLCINNFGALPHRKVLRSMELLAKEVIPNLKNETAKELQPC